MNDKQQQQKKFASLGTRTICELVGPLCNSLALLPFKVILSQPASQPKKKKKKNLLVQAQQFIWSEAAF